MNLFIAELSIIWTVIKTTVIGKIGAGLVALAPILAIIGASNHLDSLLTSLPSVLTVIAGVLAILKGQRDLHLTMNSRLDELVSAVKKSSFAEGEQAERDRAEEKKKS
jgi:hypothetical protein